LPNTTPVRQNTQSTLHLWQFCRLQPDISHFRCFSKFQKIFIIFLAFQRLSILCLDWTTVQMTVQWSTSTWPGEWLCRLRIFMVFLSLSKNMPKEYLKLGHDNFLLYQFLSISDHSFYDSTLYSLQYQQHHYINHTTSQYLKLCIPKKKNKVWISLCYLLKMN